MTDPERSPREALAAHLSAAATHVTGAPWFVVVNDLVGGWSISTSPFPLSHGRGVTIADFMRRDDAEFCVAVRNALASTMAPEHIGSAPADQIGGVKDDGTVYLKPQEPPSGA